MNAIMKGAAAEHIREGIPVLASYCDALGVRGRGQQRRQGLAAQGPPRAEIGRLGHPPAGFAAGDV